MFENGVDIAYELLKEKYKSQSEFCNRALEFYISYLENADNDYLGKTIT